MCNGAKSIHSFNTSTTSSVITTDLLIFSPPCTNLCPIADISSKLSITLYSGFINCFNVKSTASSCVFAGCLISIFCPFTLCVIKASSSPILSYFPEAKTSSVSIFIN